MHEPLILPYNGIWPKIHPSAFIAPNATVIGDVEIGADSSIWFGCVVRGDINKIRIGARTNIQDNCVVHVATDREVARARGEYDTDGYPIFIGDDVLIGHGAVLHACTIESGAFIGMGSIILDGAKVEGPSMVAAGSLIAPNKVVRAGELWMGNPAEFRRRLAPAELEEFGSRPAQYARLAQEFKKGLQK